MSLEFNKMAAAVLTAGVVAMTTGFIANLLVHPDPREENAYPIEVADATCAAPAAAEEPGLEPVLPLLADADLAAGEAAFRACASCHTYEEGGPNRVGPNLWGVVGAPHAHIEGFNYSDAMMERSDEPWTYEALNAFLASPQEAIPGTRMAFGGIRNVEDRANLIAWLRTLDNEPEPLPTEEEIQAVAGDEPAAAEEGEAAAGEEATVEQAEAQPSEDVEAAAGTAEGDAAAPASGSGGDSGLIAAIAEADPQDGQNIFRRCAACHTYEEGGPNRVGPNLWNVVGGPVAHLDNFNYSDAAEEMAAEGVTWSYDNLSAFLERPQDFMPGTRMVFPGLPNEADRAALIAFLRQQSDEPAPLPSGEEAAAEEAAAAPAEEDEAEADQADAGAQAQAEAEAADAGGGEAAGGGDSALIAAIGEADPQDGESIFRRCTACHTYEEGGPNRVGPNLWNVVGGPVAHLDNFNYSDAAEEMAAEGVTWNYENLSAFLERPQDFMPGTRMVFPGLPNEADRAALIAFLRQQSDEPAPLPSGEAAAAEEAAAAPAEEDEAEADQADAGAQAQAEAEAADAGGGEAAGGGDSALIAAIGEADPAEGESVARRCAACHTFNEGGPNRVGPNLWNVVGGPVAHLDNFNYSDAAQQMGEEGVTWTHENLSAFLENPRDFMPGTRMVFPGLRHLEDRAAMIAYMRSMGSDAPPLE